MRKQEIRAEKDRQKELRERRRQEGRRGVGLEMVNEIAIEEHRRKVKEQI